MKLRILSGGAAQGLVQAVSAAFQTETGLSVDGNFGAVGAMRDELLAGAPCDLLILTQALIETLERDGHVVPVSSAPIGTVRTGVAVRSGSPVPVVSDSMSLSRALSAADGIFFPDPKRATAGIHFAKVLQGLGFDPSNDPRMSTHANGATAMAELARSSLASPIGCTQVTEIMNTPGVTLAGLLPKEFELATVYTAAIATRAQHPGEAKVLLELLRSTAAQPHRHRLGFTVD